MESAPTFKSGYFLGKGLTSVGGHSICPRKERADMESAPTFESGNGDHAANRFHNCRRLTSFGGYGRIILSHKMYAMPLRIQKFTKEKSGKMLISIIATIISLVASWMIFKKMGRQGWEGIIPVYNTYVICQELYGNGWKMLCMLIPFYNIYFCIKLYIDWAHAFHKGTGFAIGMIFLPFIFQLILALDSNAYYGDGSQANNAPDVISSAVNKATGFTAAAVQKPQRDDSALEKLSKLADLKAKGIITEEEFEAKKAELLDKV